MAENSIIAWTHNTFNPWIGCVKVSEGCRNCYAEVLVKGRMNRPGLWGPASTHGRERTSPANWQKPVRWNREAEKLGATMRVFCASLCDVFEDHDQANAARPDLFALIRATPYLQWQLLTKRPENIAEMLPDDWGDRGYHNVWLGTSVENMKVAERVAILGEIPAPVRFMSYEPALGPLDELDLAPLDWVIVGGESGSKFRPMPLDWPRAMRRKCLEQDVAFFFKQSAAPRTEMGTTLDGEIVRAYPIPRSLHDNGTKSERITAAMRLRITHDLAGHPEAPFFEGPRPSAIERAKLPLFGE